MLRRRVLVGTAVVMAGVAGCMGRDMRVEASEPTTAPGAEWRVVIEADHIAGMQLSSIPDTRESAPIKFVTDGARTESSGVEIEPVPDSVVDASPPYWFWDSRVSVEVGIPYSVTDDVAPGEYEYEVTVFADADPDARSISRTASITVPES